MAKDYADFVAITAALNGLYALDASGGVWHYIPADQPRGTYAMWTKLTEYRKDPAQKKEKAHA